MTAFEKIYEVVRQVPSGTVTTYGMVARLAGNARWARAVGYALHANPDPATIPCHRVLNRFGEVCEGFVFGGAGVQRGMLEKEGVQFGDDGRVDLKQFGWLQA